jgi:hypothetical protein
VKINKRTSGNIEKKRTSKSTPGRRASSKRRHERQSKQPQLLFARRDRRPLFRHTQLQRSAWTRKKTFFKKRVLLFVRLFLERLARGRGVKHGRVADAEDDVVEGGVDVVGGGARGDPVVDGHAVLGRELAVPVHVVVAVLEVGVPEVRRQPAGVCVRRSAGARCGVVACDAVRCDVRCVAVCEESRSCQGRA